MTDPIAPAAPAPAAKDNLFGVCAAIGEDFGFDPIYLRVAFATALLFSLEAVLATYAALGAVVLLSRLIAPNRKGATRPPVAAPVAEEMVVVEEPLRRAA